MEEALTFLRHLHLRRPTSLTVATTTTPTSDDDDGPFFDLEILPQDKDPTIEEDTISDSSFPSLFSDGGVVAPHDPSDPKPLSARLRFLLTEKERELSRYLGKVRLMVLRRSGEEEGKEEEKVVVVAEEKSKRRNTKQRVLLRRMRVVGLRGKGSKSGAAVAAEVVGKRRDDSLLDLQDGIQSAIAYCKNSLNANLDAVVTTTPEQSGNNNKHNEDTAI